MAWVKWLVRPWTERSSKFLLPIVLFWSAVLLLLALSQAKDSVWFQAIVDSSAQLGNRYERWFGQQVTANPLFLLPLAFAGGLLSSISPCILSLLPINLTYIGTRDITSRRDALVKASLFVLGVVTVLSVFGLFSALMVAVLVNFRGYVHILIGLFIILMGCSFWGILRLPLPQMQFERSIANPYGVGLMFALVSSPCASPVKLAVLAAGAATGSQVLSVLAMVSFALGYTAIIFFASLFTGLVKQTRTVLQNSQMVIHSGSIVLILIGGYYLVDGLRWVAIVLSKSA
jgi:cytochrome c-type biogenesis protein